MDDVRRLQNFGESWRRWVGIACWFIFLITHESFAGFGWFVECVLWFFWDAVSVPPPPAPRIYDPYFDNPHFFI